MSILNPSIKHHIIIGFLIGIWTFIFAFIIRPFDDGTLNFRLWALISIGFSLMTFFSYTLLAIIQKSVYLKLSSWNIHFEIASLILFYLVYLLGIYVYYKSPILAGGYTFMEFTTIIFLKLALISAPVIILARRYLIKLIPVKEDILTIRGDNKLDLLRITKSDLICVSNAQNYIEIFHTENGQLKSKLIRYSLKKMQEDFDILVQIHRSHLINLSHFKSWKNSNTIYLTQIELPVSKNYKDQLLSL
ncbi:histidine kinase [Salegentibacter salinarum]|uniref:Histidine kinase n=1 Tax=Salegentibacter salinarum TaxID=447422 RepID=A0A2N0U051_9FLAO|nr:LytTR family DNA-binding domain-containing protein [Salegentibacter salinarum]PKD20374.1 histidine kinase [Salegentibacter salinarum]SKB85518.1 LytTr DNA-binding domain-containing protein [Salegentibacter salinarum]